MKINICLFHVINVMTEAAIKYSSVEVLISYLNLAVSGSISSSSLTGERGTLAENFSVSSEGMEGYEIKKKKKSGIIKILTPSNLQYVNTTCKSSRHKVLNNQD